MFEIAKNLNKKRNNRNERNYLERTTKKTNSTHCVCIGNWAFSRIGIVNKNRTWRAKFLILTPERNRVFRLLSNSNHKQVFCVLSFIKLVRIKFSRLRIILTSGSVSTHAIAIALSQIHNKYSSMCSSSLGGWW